MKRPALKEKSTSINESQNYANVQNMWGKLLLFIGLGEHKLGAFASDTEWKMGWRASTKEKNGVLVYANGRVRYRV